MKRSVLIKPSIIAKEIKSDNYDLLGNVSEWTIRRRLQTELGLPSRDAAKKPFLNENMCKEDYIFVRNSLLGLLMIGRKFYLVMNLHF